MRFAPFALSFSLLLATQASFAAGPAKAKAAPAPRKRPAVERVAPPVQYESQESSIPKPQVLEEGSSLLGARIAVGHTTFFGVSYEHMITQNIGAIGDLRYGRYSTTATLGAVGLDWKHTAWAFGAQASFHADLFKLENLDTYLSAGLARTMVSSKYTANGVVPTGTVVEAKESSWDLLAYANARYFFSPSWAVHASLGTGMGTFALGADYHF